MLFWKKLNKNSGVWLSRLCGRATLALVSWCEVEWVDRVVTDFMSHSLRGFSPGN